MTWLLVPQLALYVLSFLEPRDLLRAAQTCRYWRVLAEDNLLWREKCREEGKGLSSSGWDLQWSRSQLPCIIFAPAGLGPRAACVLLGALRQAAACSCRH